MSTWNIGANDVSEETQNFRNKLSSKDTQIAAQQSQLIKQAAELSDLKQSLDEALHKLSREADRALRLDKELIKCSEDLRNEKLNVLNLESTLETARRQVKEKDLEAREVQATLESLSHQSDGIKTNSNKLEQEKKNLEIRVRELEANIHHLGSRPPSPVRKRRQHRSSSLSEFMVPSLQTELDKYHASLAQKDADLLIANERLASLRTDLLKLDNEKVAMERKLESRLRDMGESLQDKEEELRFFKMQQDGDGSKTREDDLLKRIDEDQAKISALEMMIRDGRGMNETKEVLKKAEQQLRLEAQKTAASEARLVEAVEQMDQLETLLREKEARIGVMTDRERDLTYRLLTFTVNGPRDNSPAASCVEQQVSANDLIRSHHDSPQGTPDEMMVTHIERLLLAVERLRNERDELRRHMDFLETEAKFSTVSSGVIAATTDRVDGQPVLTNNAIEHVSPEGTVQIPDPFAIEGKAQIAANHLSEDFAIMQYRLQERDTKLAELEIKLEVTVQCLADATTRCDALQSQVSQLESRDEERLIELERLNNAYKDTQSLLECAESSITEITTSIDEVQAERDSLVLQLTNLQTDFCNAQEDLAEAERRYSTLQFHQLSSMSSNEAIKSLRRQIEELENRVLRRTEQIGIHQHDIKRLETNMRLQEERIAEMTAELETLSAQKEAMVEDCADAREARDEALQKVEDLEMELEELEGRAQALEGRIQYIEQSRDVELSSLVGIVSEAIGQSRIAKQRARVAEEKFSQIPPMRRDTPIDDVRQAVVTLALSRLESENQVSTLLVQHDDTHRSATQQTKQVQDLEANCQSLRGTIAELERNYGATVQELAESKIQIQMQMQLVEAAKTSGEDLQVQLNRLRDQHANELATVKNQLVLTAEDLDCARRQHSEAERLNRETANESSRLKQELENSSQALTDRIRLFEKLETELSNLHAKHAEEVLRLQQQLDTAAEQALQCQSSLEILRSDHQQTLDKLARTEKENESRLSVAVERSQADKRQLESELTRSASQLAILQARYDTCCETITELERQLQDELNCRNFEREEHEKEVVAISERSTQSESTQAKLREEVDALRDELDKSKLAFETIQEEKEALRLEMTNLEAEIQRSISLGRYLESQVKESERTIASLKEALERTRADLSSSEKSGKAAEISLSLHVAQNERAMTNLQRELAALRSKPNLEETVARLEEKVQEMEESLRSKCAEIEENDDKVIEMLKEKKKLITKIDNLKRKIQNLQGKLATNAASNPAPIPEPEKLENKDATALSAKPFLNALASTSTSVPRLPRLPEPITPTPATRPPSSRAVSGPSILLVPKSPAKKSAGSDTRMAHKLVARTRTSDPQPPSSSVNRKRKIPDEYDECAPPVQGFSVDCLPVNDVVNTPPRRRLHSHSGFTPTRSRPLISSPNPARVPLSVSYISNSPRHKPQIQDSSTKPTKRTWLGKIKGATRQAAVSGANSYGYDRVHGEIS